jgi:hypothetical protein
VPILRQEEAKKVLLNRIFGSSISYNKSDDTYMSPRNLKTTGRWARKAVELSKAVISSRNTEPSLPKMSSKTHFAPVDQQEEKSIGASMRKALKKITNAIKKTRNYTERDKR